MIFIEITSDSQTQSDHTFKTTTMQQIGKDFEISAPNACSYYRFSSDDENTRVILWGYPNYDVVTGSKGEPRYIGDVVFCIDGSPTVVCGTVPESSPDKTNGTQTQSCSSGENSIIKLGGFSYSTKSFQSFHEKSVVDSFDIKQVIQFGANVYVRTNLGVHILTEGRDCTTVSIRYIPIQSTCMALRGDYLYIFQKYAVSQYTLNGVHVKIFDRLTPFYKFDEFCSVLLVNTVFIVTTSNGDLCSIDQDMNIKSIVHPDICHRPFIHCNTLYTIGLYSHKIRLFQSAEYVASEQSKLKYESLGGNIIMDYTHESVATEKTTRDAASVVNSWLHMNGETIMLQECVDLDKLKIIVDNFEDPIIQTSLAKFKTRHKYNKGDYISQAICGYYDQNTSSQVVLRSLYDYLSSNTDENRTSLNPSSSSLSQTPSSSSSLNTAFLQVSYRQKGLWILGGSGGYGEYGRGGNVETDAKTTRGGRYFSTSIASFQNMSKPLRQTLCKSIYWDVDMVNAFPTIFSQYCHAHNISCPVVNQYVANRDEIIGNSGLSKDAFKSFFFAVMTHSKTISKVKFNANPHYISPSPSALQFFQDLSAEIDWIGLHFARLNSPKNGSSGKHKNLSLDDSFRYIIIEVLCSIENEIMWHAFQFLKEQGYHADVMCFDGFMVRQQGDVASLERTLVNLSAFIRQKTAYHVNFVVKPMTDAIDLSKLATKK